MPLQPMSPMPLQRPQPPQESAEPSDLFDYRRLREYAAFAIHSLARRKGLALTVFTAVFGCAVLSLYALPKEYDSEVKLLGQRNQVISSLAVPGRNMPTDADAPARAAFDTIMRRDNLVALIDQTGLVAHFYSHRSPAGRLKDRLNALLGREMNEDAKLDTVLGMLEKRLVVSSAASWQGEGTVSIGVEWPDPVMAHTLVEAAQQSFIEARHISELSNIAEAISILEGHSALMREEVEEAADSLARVRNARAARSAPAPSPAPAAQPKPARPTEASLQLKSIIDAKQRAIDDLEDFRRKRLLELQARLSEQKAIYSETHPIVVDLALNVRSMSNESPQVATLRREMNDLRSEYLRRGGSEGAEKRGFASLPSEIVKVEVTERSLESPEEISKQTMLHQALSKYTALLDRIDSAKIEMDTARAAFKYRYSVFWPARIPNKPAKPKVPMVLGAGLVAGLLLALFASTAADVISRRVLEPWQVERDLAIPILGRVSRT
jgi:uncharacterized protein involved in exopolysaccharide biosynthesis